MPPCAAAAAAATATTADVLRCPAALLPRPQVTCGSVIKLEADKTRHVLHSHEVSYGYGRGSGQQSVTGYPEMDQAGSLWIVRAEDVSIGRACTDFSQAAAAWDVP